MSNDKTPPQRKSPQRKSPQRKSPHVLQLATVWAEWEVKEQTLKAEAKALQERITDMNRKRRDAEDALLALVGKDEDRLIQTHYGIVVVTWDSDRGVANIRLGQVES